MATLTLPPDQTVTALRTHADVQALYEHLEDIAYCIAGALIGHEDGNDQQITESLHEAMDRCWFLMAHDTLARLS